MLALRTYLSIPTVQRSLTVTMSELWVQPRNGIELQLKHDLRAMTHLDELPTLERSLKVRRVHILHANHTRHTGPFGAQNANGHLTVTFGPHV